MTPEGLLRVLRWILAFLLVLAALVVSLILIAAILGGM